MARHRYGSRFTNHALYILTSAKQNEENYSTIFRWAADYIAAQESSVPSEQFFFSSAETDTRRRNRITPDLMEKLQMLKYMIKKARLDFTRAGE